MYSENKLEYIWSTAQAFVVDSFVDSDERLREDDTWTSVSRHRCESIEGIGICFCRSVPLQSFTEFVCGLIIHLRSKSMRKTAILTF